MLCEVVSVFTISVQIICDLGYYALQCFLFSRRIEDYGHSKDKTNYCPSSMTALVNNASKGPEKSDQNVNNESDEQDSVVFVSR